MATLWHKTKEVLPDTSEDPLDRGWVLGRFGRDKFATVRYVKDYNKWQMWDYNWSPCAPEYWCYIIDEEICIPMSNYITTSNYWESPSQKSTPETTEGLSEGTNSKVVNITNPLEKK